MIVLHAKTSSSSVKRSFDEKHNTSAGKNRLIALPLCLLLGISNVGCHAKQQVVNAQTGPNAAESAGNPIASTSTKAANGDADTQDSASGSVSFPTWTSPSGAVASVPLTAGLTVVTAIAQDGGDYESIKRIDKITADSVSLNYRADNVGGDNSSSHGGSTVTSHRTIRVPDLQNAHMYAQTFGTGQPDLIPGSTAISVSHEVFAELKGKKSTAFTFQAGGLKGALGSLLSGLGQLTQTGGNPPPKEVTALSSMDKEDCTLERIGDKLSSFPVLLNDQRVNLPAIHAQCSISNGNAVFYILDNPENPLMLAWKLGDSGDTLQVVKISYATPEAAKEPAPAIEQELKQNGQADVYGIYFDFGSDKIKPESESVLREIAETLNHNPSWKLRVEGHTDNIGGDDYNNKLSQQRAEAVKQALVSRYHISSDKLTAQGFGSTQPKESNETLAGRARNRRVELVRE